MKFVVPDTIKHKLSEKHNVSEIEIIECFSNVPNGGFLIDTREDHQTDPPTHWFIAETNVGRELCVCFMQLENRDIHIKTAFEPSEERKKIYIKFTRKR